MGNDGHGLGLIDDETCFGLLGGSPVGRLGFSSGSLPVIFPVNYLLVDRTIVFCSEEGVKLRAAEQRAVACLQIDHFETFGHSGWSVMATGRLELAPPEHLDEFARLPLAPWGLTGAHRYVELPVELISGRSVGRP